MAYTGDLPRVRRRARATRRVIPKRFQAEVTVAAIDADTWSASHPDPSPDIDGRRAALTDPSTSSGRR
jgi:hypothetical protein